MPVTAAAYRMPATERGPVVVLGDGHRYHVDDLLGECVCVDTDRIGRRIQFDDLTGRDWKRVRAVLCP